MVISLLKLCANIQNYFWVANNRLCFYENTYYRKILQRRMYLIRISDYLYVAHYHGNKGFVIIRFVLIVYFAA